MRLFDLNYNMQTIVKNPLKAMISSECSILLTCVVSCKGWGGGQREGLGSQSRQSAQHFSSRPNWDSPTSLGWGGGGGGYTLACGRRVGMGPNSDEGTETVVL